VTRLHITNGDSALGQIAGIRLSGTFLSWLDVLHEGPVPALPPDRLRVMRAQFIAERGWDDFASALSRLAERDAALARADTFDEVVLWFEHDLFDQLQLLDILSRLAQPDRRHESISLAQADRYLSEMDDESLHALFEQRQPVTSDTLVTAREAWAAFTSADPRALHAASLREANALPFVAPALRRVLEELPERRTGLSRCERQALDPFASRPRTIGEAFRHAREEPAFLGDSVFAWHLERLSAEPVTLVRLVDGEPIRAPRVAEGGEPSFWAQRAELTEAGHAVLDGRADAVRLRGVDRWIGGVHLCAEVGIWRWDDDDGLSLDASDASATTPSPTIE